MELHVQLMCILYLAYKLKSKVFKNPRSKRQIYMHVKNTHIIDKTNLYLTFINSLIFLCHPECKV